MVALAKLFSALVSWLGVGKTLQLFSFGRRLLDEKRKLIEALKSKVKK